MNAFTPFLFQKETESAWIILNHNVSQATLALEQLSEQYARISFYYYFSIIRKK